MNSISLTGIDHPAIAAENVDQLTDWYCDVLGYVKYFRHDKPVWIIRAPDSSFIEIMPKDHTERPERTTWTPGWSHLALRVEDINAAIEYLDTQNIQWGGELINAVGGGWVRTFYDPEGNMLQLIQRE